MANNLTLYFTAVPFGVGTGLIAWLLPWGIKQAITLLKFVIR
ncbi:hypothetical protein FACS18949_13430 [Clostridia bacterium]|nr:hypothetical protein FACS18949_13430 [Clostridia bacterium]